MFPSEGEVTCRVYFIVNVKEPVFAPRSKMFKGVNGKAVVAKDFLFIFLMVSSSSRMVKGSYALVNSCMVEGEVCIIISDQL